MTALMSVNVYFLGAGNSTWNPNITLAFSFLFLPILYEYIYNENKNKKINLTLECNKVDFFFI